MKALEGARMHVSLRELVGPYVEESYDNLPAEVQGEVVKYFTPDSWNASSTAGRSSFLRRYDEQVDTERAEIAETLAKHAYWFGLQSEILRTEREIADLRSLAERNSNQDDSGHATISALQAQLAALHEKWHHPDDLGAKAQLAAEKATLGQIPIVLDIPRALHFLSENTSVAWTDAQLLSLVSSSDISLYVAVSPWTPMYILEWKDIGLRKRPFVQPAGSVLVALSPDRAQEMWVSGETASSTWVLTEPLGVRDFVYLEAPAIVLLRDIRLTRTMLLQILQKWEASRHPIAPRVGSNPSSLSSSGDLPELPPLRSPLEEETVKPSSTPSLEPSARAAPEWIASAREIAGQYLARHKQNDLYPSLKDVCAHVEEQLRAKRTFGAHHRPLSAAYIGRNALQGDWWSANKP
jgi:hypothetical protein